MKCDKKMGIDEILKKHYAEFSAEEQEVVKGFLGNQHRKWDYIDDIITAVIEHSEVWGIKDYSGNAEIQIDSPDKLRAEIKKLINNEFPAVVEVEL